MGGGLQEMGIFSRNITPLLFYSKPKSSKPKFLVQTIKDSVTRCRVSFVGKSQKRKYIQFLVKLLFCKQNASIVP